MSPLIIEIMHFAYLELAEACMSTDPNDRPPFHTMHIVSFHSQYHGC